MMDAATLLDYLPAADREQITDVLCRLDDAVQDGDRQPPTAAELLQAVTWSSHSSAQIFARAIEANRAEVDGEAA